MKRVLLAFLVMVICMPVSSAVWAQDRAFDRYKHFESRSEHGRGLSDSDDAADLSWGESYTLNSYVDIYNAYRDSYWLDKFVDHFDRVKASAKDLEGDGSYGWYSPLFSYQQLENHDFEWDAPDAEEAEEIANGGFETAGGDGVPAGWTREAGNASVVYRTTAAGEYYTGGAGLAVKDNGTSGATLKQSFAYSPGRNYVLSFAVKTNSRLTVAQVQIYNESTSQVVAQTPAFDVDNMIFMDDWVERNLTFTAPASSGQTLAVKLKLASLDQSGWAVYFDDISLKPTETVVNAVKNGGFETASVADATLPDQWSRSGGSAYTFLSSVPGEYHSGSNGVVIKSDGTTWKDMYQSLPYQPGAQYSLTVWGKTNSPSAYGRILVYDLTDSAYVLDQYFNNTSWEKLSYAFTAPAAAGHNLQIFIRQLYHTEPAWVVYFDDLQIEPVAENANDNAQFEMAAADDSTLPDGWERFQSTSANAHLTDTLNEYFSRTKGAVIESNSTQTPMLRKPLYLIPETRYTVNFWGRNNHPSAQGQVEVYDATTSQVLGSVTFSNTSWQPLAFTFTAPSSASDTIYLRLRQAGTAANNSEITYFDDLNVMPDVHKGAASWTRVGKTKETAFTSRAVGEALSGYFLEIGNDGATDGYVKQKLLAYAPNKPYSVFFSGKTNAAANGGKVTVYDVTAAAELGSLTFTSTEWDFLRLDFTTPIAPDHLIEIRLGQQYADNSAQIAYFDNVIAGERVSFLVNDTMIVKPALRFVQAVYDDPALTANYGAKADEYLAFVEDDVMPKWDAYYRDLGNGRGTYVYPTDNAGAYFPGRAMPHNHYLVSAECYLLLGKLAGNSAYTAKAASLLQFFKDHLRVNSQAATAYEWNYWDASGPWDAGMVYVSAEEATTKGNLDIAAALAGYHNGVVFTAADMKKFASTFVDVMWNGSLAMPVISSNVVLRYNITEFLFGWTPYIWEFVKLAEFDPLIREIAEQTVRNREDSHMLPLLAALAVYNPETTINGDFEFADANDATLPAFWERYLAYTTSSTAYRDTGNANRGAAGAALITNGNAWNILQQKIEGYLPNSDYELKFMAKAGSASAQARVDVFNYSDLSLAGVGVVSNTSWTPGSMAFTTPAAADKDLRIDLYHDVYSPASLSVYFDDVKLYASLWNSFVPNGGFEEENRFDATLPAYWERESGTLASRSALDTAEKYKGATSLKLTTDPSAGSQQLSYSLQGLKPGASYTLSFYAKTNGSAAKAKARAYNATTSTNLGVSAAVNSTSWAQYSVTFTAPATYTDTVKIMLEHDDPNTSGGIAYFDEVGVTIN